MLPLDDRRIERFNADLAGRPELVKGNTQLLFGGMGRLTENSVLNIKNKSHAVTAEVVVPDGGRRGRDHRPGRRLRRLEPVREGRHGRSYCYNLLGLQRFKIEGDAAIPPGTHQVRMEFDYDGGGLAKGGTVTLYLDGDKVGEGRVEATVPMIFSARRDRRRRPRHRVPGQRRLRRREQRLHRHGQLGADRPRRGRRGRRPPDHARGTPARRDGETVSTEGQFVDAEALIAASAAATCARERSPSF